MYGSKQEGFKSNGETNRLLGQSSNSFDLTRHLGRLADKQYQRPQPDTADDRMEGVPEGRAREVNLKEACKLINSVEASVLEYRDVGWEENDARKHVLEKLSPMEQQDYHHQVKLICATIDKMNQIPEGQNESGLNRLIDQAVKARNECFERIRQKVPSEDGGRYIETGADLFMRIQKRASEGHIPTQWLLHHLNSIVAIGKSLSVLKDTYSPEHLARTYARIELLISSAEGGPELEALQTAWIADRPSYSQDKGKGRAKLVPSTPGDGRSSSEDVPLALRKRQDKGKGKEHTESGPSQDTGDIGLKEETKKSIMEIASYAGNRADSSNKGSEHYISIKRSCGTIRLFYGMFDIYHIKRARRRYSHQQTRKDIVNAAHTLEATINNDFFNNKPEISKHRDTISEWVKNIGLSEEQT